MPIQRQGSATLHPCRRRCRHAPCRINRASKSHKLTEPRVSAHGCAKPGGNGHRAGVPRRGTTHHPKKRCIAGGAGTGRIDCASARNNRRKRHHQPHVCRRRRRNMGLCQMMRLRRITIPIPPPSLGEDLSSPSKIEGVARRAGGVCQPATLAATQDYTLLRPDGHLPWLRG